MIEEIRIRGLGVIDDAVLEPHAGFTALTGETGAGKTMVLTGLGLLLGGRADAGAVRAGGERAEVEGRVRSPPAGVLDRVDDAGGDLDDGLLVLARTVSSEGRSRAWLGGRSVPASVLAEIADDLVAVHGQSDQQRLLAPARQRAALDRFGGAELASGSRDYRAAYDRLREVERELDEITAHARERAQEADLLRHGLGEIEAVAPSPGSGRPSRAESSRLSYAEQLREAASSAHEALRSAGDAVDAERSRCWRARDDPSTRSATTTPSSGSSPTGSPRPRRCSPTSRATSRRYAASVEADPAAARRGGGTPCRPGRPARASTATRSRRCSPGRSGRRGGCSSSTPTTSGIDALSHERDGLRARLGAAGR